MEDPQLRQAAIDKARESERAREGEGIRVWGCDTLEGVR